MTHKLTLESPPDGYEAAAEWRVPLYGEWIIAVGRDDTPIVNLGNWIDTCRIVLTPKKRKFWRLDPVATFEEATPTDDQRFRYALDGISGTLTALSRGYPGPRDWLKLTEHSE